MNTLQTLTPVDLARSNLAAMIDAAETREAAIDIHGKAKDIAAAFRELVQRAEQRCIELIDRDGDYELGDVRFYVGRDKRTKPRNKALALAAIFDITQGDMGKAVEFFSSDPFKYGAIKAGLETGEGLPTFDELFEVTEVQDLKTGKPKRGLQNADKKFLR